MSRPDDEMPDQVSLYLADYLDAIESGEEPPSLDDLDETTRAQVTEVLGALTGSEGTVTAAAVADAGGIGELAEALAAAAGSDVDSRPRAESEFAVAHGFVRPAPDVVVVGPAVRRARTAAGLTLAQVVAAMSRRGSEIESATLDEVERSPTFRMPPRDARLLAAVLDLPLSAVEATAEPWPADTAGLDTVRQLGVPAVALEGVAVVRTSRGDYLGLLRCSGDAAMLDSRTYREAAAERLTGAWSHLAGALLVTEQPPHRALAVDALDCVTRAHAPTGLSGFSRLGQPEPLAEALASYDETYAVHWTDPEPLEAVEAGGPGAGPLDGLGTGTGPADADAGSGAGTDGTADTDGTSGTGGTDPGLGAFAGRIDLIAERLADEARRARQAGKRPGYEAAARWLAGTTAHDLMQMLEDLADLSPDEPDEARAWLEEVIPP
jgi:hypothetical protein